MCQKHPASRKNLSLFQKYESLNDAHAPMEEVALFVRNGS